MPLLPHDRDRLRQQPAAPGHGLREDRGRRDRALQAACGFETRFVMGNDEHSQNVFRKARELGDWIRWRTATGWTQEFRDVWSALDISFDDFIRTTEPRHRAASQELVRRMSAAGDIYEGHLRRLVLRRRARPSSRRRTSSTARARSTGRSRTGSARRTISSGSRSTSDRCWSTSQAHPEFLVPEIRRNEILAADRRRGSRTSRSAAPASRGAFRCRTIRRA